MTKDRKETALLALGTGAAISIFSAADWWGWVGTLVVLIFLGIAFYLICTASAPESQWEDEDEDEVDTDIMPWHAIPVCLRYTKRVIFEAQKDKTLWELSTLTTGQLHWYLGTLDQSLTLHSGPTKKLRLSFDEDSVQIIAFAGAPFRAQGVDMENVFWQDEEETTLGIHLEEGILWFHLQDEDDEDEAKA